MTPAERVSRMALGVVEIVAEIVLEVVETMSRVFVEPADGSCQVMIPRMIPKANVHSFSPPEHQFWYRKVFFQRMSHL